jgi:hypothetical protein
MKTIAPLLIFFTILLPIQLLLAQSGLTVEKATDLLDNLKEQQYIPTLKYSDTVDRTIYITFIEHLAHNIGTNFKNMGVIQANSFEYRLTLEGIYKLPPVFNQITLKYGSKEEQLIAPSYLFIENTAFGLRYYLEGRDSDAQTRINNEAIQILSLLGIASGLVKKEEVAQMKAADWKSVSRALEDNPFLVNQLEGIRFSTLPLDHPLTDTIVARLNAQATNFFDSLHAPVMDSAILQTEVSGDYFSLQDIESSYRQPVLADANAELRAAGDRIQVRRQSEGRPDATAIIAGLTDFVLERAKEEFSVSFLERMRTDFTLGGKKRPGELRLLFPKTFNFFSTKADLSNYKSILPMARQEFIYDLRDLGLNIHKLLEDSDYPEYKKLRNSGELFHLALFYEIASMAYQGIALDTITNNILTRLERREKDLFKQENFEIAEFEYRAKEKDTLQIKTGQFTRNLDKLAQLILRKKLGVSPIFLSLSNSARNDTEKTAVKTMFGDYRQTIAQKDPQYYQWMEYDQYEQMLNIPKLLEGKRYYYDLMREPTLDQFEQHFPSTPDSTYLIATGMELSKKLVSTLPNGTDMPNFLAEYYRYLTDVEKKAVEMTKQFNRANDTTWIRPRADSLRQDQDSLRAMLGREINFWGDYAKGVILEDNLQALKYLDSAFNASTLLVIPDTLSSTEAKQAAIQAIAAKEQDIKQTWIWVEARLNIFEQKTNLRSPLLPTIKQLLAPTPSQPTAAQPQPTLLDTILQQREEIRQLLERMDAQFVPKLDTALKETQQMKKVVSMAAVLIACLKADAATSNGNRYIDPRTFRNILSQDRSRDFFLGITMQRLQAILRPDSLATISQKGVAAATNKFVDVIFEMQQRRDSLNNIPNGKLQFTEYFPLVRSTMDLFNTLIISRINDKDARFGLLHKAPRITDQTLSMFENVQAERYGSALLNMVELFTLISQSNDSASRRWNAVRSDLIRYGSFMANVASATTANEVKGALLSVAMPPGSSRLKREDVFNVALNAYLGLSGGIETLNTPGLAKPRAASIGLGLPIGISTTWKFKRDSRMSYSALLSILDLGAVAAFRLGDNTAQDLPELKFENFVAPGGFLVANFPKSPFSLGLGAQYGPQVRKITLNGIDESQSSAWRLTAFAAIDVPVFNFVSKKGRVGRLK